MALEFLTTSVNWQVLMPELVVLLFAVMAPIVALGGSDRKGMQGFTLMGLGFALVMTIASLIPDANGRLGLHFPMPGLGTDFTTQWIGAQLPDENPVYAITQASQLLKLLFLAVGFVAVLGVGRPLKGRVEEDWGEFCSLILFSILGMMVVVSSRELFTLMLGVETASLSSYLLAAFARNQAGAEAGLKYFVIGAVSSGMSLFGVSVLYAATGTTHLAGIASHLTLGSGLDGIAILGAVLFAAGLGFKISLVPFHAWAPDVYSGSPAPVAGVLASASKAMGFIALAQVFLVALWNVKADWELAVALLAVATMFVGNLIALQQTNLRRMLAFSSIAQAGYLMIAIAVGSWYALGGAILHLFVNAAMKLGAFLVIGALLWAGIPDHVDNWKGLGKRAPFLALAMAIFLFSMAGLPPFGGFVSKFVLFSGAVQPAVQQGVTWLWVLAGAAILNSAISLYYYLRVVRAMYVEKGDSEDRLPVGPGITIAVGVCLALVLAVSVFPQWFFDQSMTAAHTMLGR